MHSTEMCAQVYIENERDEELKLFRIEVAAPFSIKFIVRSDYLVFAFFLVLDISLL